MIFQNQRQKEVFEKAKREASAMAPSRAFVDMSDHEARMDKVKATREIASRIAAAQDTAPCEVLPTSEWSPTIGQSEAANSDEPTWGMPGRYTLLRDILISAYDHAATGKGKERHARDLPFDKQPMLETTRLVGPGFPLGQAIKKAGEAAGMIDRSEYDAAEAECLGAINYLAGAVAWVRERREKEMAEYGQGYIPPAPTSVGAAA